MIWLNDKLVEFNDYPNGETRIDLLPFSHVNHIRFRYENDQDLIRLMFLRKHLEAPVGLHIEYMPYSRMDRVEGDSIFTLKYVCDLINWLNFSWVEVAEPHSDVTTALLDRCETFYPTRVLLEQVKGKMGFTRQLDYLFYPDAGAQKRYAGITGHKTAVGFKHRDFETGKLSGEMEVVGFDPLPASQVLIVDDLCSYGGTFVMAADKLREMGAEKVFLFVAHCENSMWKGELLYHIDGLFTTDSILTLDKEFELRPLGRKVHVYSEGEWK